VLRPVKWVYSGAERLLGAMGLADNLFIVLRKKWWWAHLDTAPDSTGTAVRRSPIRRVSGCFWIPAGSETGAPGAVSRRAP